MRLLMLPAVIGFSAPKGQGLTWYDPNQLLAGHWLLLLVLTIVALLLIMPRSSTRPLELARELIILIPAVLLYDVARGLVEGREDEAVARALQLIHLERMLGLDWEPFLQRHILDLGAIVNFMNFTYLLGMWPVVILTALWLFFRRRTEYALYRNAFLISGAISLVIYALLPVAPPRFVDGFGLMDTVAQRTAAYSLPDAPILVNNYAAVPSLHFGWVLLCGIAIIRHTSNPLAKLLGVYFPLAMFFSIVTTGNHFVLDAITGGMVATLGLILSTGLRTTVTGAYGNSSERVSAFANEMF